MSLSSFFMSSLPNRSHAVVGLLTLGLFALAGCSALDVNAPTKLRGESLENGTGVVLAMNGSRQALNEALQRSVFETGSLTDEFISYSELGKRDSAGYVLRYRRDGDTPMNALYYKWQEAYRDISINLALVRKGSSADLRGVRVGETLALRGFVLLGLAEQICPGFSRFDLEIDGDVVKVPFNSDPQTADSAFSHALANFDSAIVSAGDSVRVSYLAQIGKARALVGLGRFAEAATAAAAIPTTYRDTLLMFSQFATTLRRSMVPELKGANGLPYVSAHDPRLVLVPNGRLEGGGAPAKWNAPNQSMDLATGIEARLLEAESQLAIDPSSGTWLTTLNTLRASVALPDTTDPGTTAGRVDLLFRERAFWLFATGHRIGDMRRLVRLYDRDPETVFPTGSFVGVSGAFVYGNLTSIPFDGSWEHEYNPKITGCLSE